MVQVVLNQGFEPAALIMYAPNFHPKLAAKWDHYEFKNVKRNGINNGLQNFLKVFIPRKPPQGWEVVRQNFVPPAIAGGQPQAPKR